MYLPLDVNLGYIPSATCEGGFYKSGFFKAAIHAFRFHKNLVIDPDIFLNTLIAQAGVLITQFAELYRADLVNHVGKHTVRVTNPSSMWKEFAEMIDIKNEEFKKLLNLKFSTTTDDVMNVRYCLVAATFAPYYRYICTECGLRGVRVEGTDDDWHRLKESLDAFGFLSKIHQNLRDDAAAAEPNPVLEWISDTKQIADRCLAVLADNKETLVETTEWWKGFVTENGRSGGPYIGGHIAKMMLVDQKGDLIDRKRKELKAFEVPNEQLLVTVEFIDGPREYLAGNFFRMSNNDQDCITEPAVKLAQ